MRNSGLDDDKRESVSKRIEQLLEDATAEMKRTKNLSLSGLLDAAYEEVKSMVDELSDPQDSVESV
jgi:ribosomal protein L11 methylase PrmA